MNIDIEWYHLEVHQLGSCKTTKGVKTIKCNEKQFTIIHQPRAKQQSKKTSSISPVRPVWRRRRFWYSFAGAASHRFVDACTWVHLTRRARNFINGLPLLTKYGWFITEPLGQSSYLPRCWQSWHLGPAPCRAQHLKMSPSSQKSIPWNALWVYNIHGF